MSLQLSFLRAKTGTDFLIHGPLPHISRPLFVLTLNDVPLRTAPSCGQLVQYAKQEFDVEPKLWGLLV